MKPVNDIVETVNDPERACKPQGLIIVGILSCMLGFWGNHKWNETPAHVTLRSIKVPDRYGSWSEVVIDDVTYARQYAKTSAGNYRSWWYDKDGNSINTIYSYLFLEDYFEEEALRIRTAKIKKALESHEAKSGQ